MGYFDTGAGYFGGPSRVRVGFGLSPQDAVQAAGGQGIAQAQGQAQGLVAQGSSFYQTATSTAAQAEATAGQVVTQASQGTLQGTLAAGTLIANQVPPGQAKSTIQSTLSQVGGIAAGGAAFVSALGASAVSLGAAFSILGGFALALVAAQQFILKNFGASGGAVTPTPPIVHALLTVPVPGVTVAGPVAAAAGEPAFANPASVTSAACNGNGWVPYGSGTAGSQTPTA